MHCISNHLYCPTVSKLWWWSVLFRAYDQNYAFIISSLLQDICISNRGWTFFFKSGNHTHICFKKTISISCTFPWLSPMLNVHLLPSVVLPALNNRPDIQQCQKHLIWKRVSFLWLPNYTDICGSPFTVFHKWLSETVRPPKANP